MTDTCGMELIFSRVTIGFRSFKFRPRGLQIGFRGDLVRKQFFLAGQRLTGQSFARFRREPSGFQTCEFTALDQRQRIAACHVIPFARIEFANYAADLGRDIGNTISVKADFGRKAERLRNRPLCNNCCFNTGLSGRVRG